MRYLILLPLIALLAGTGLTTARAEDLPEAVDFLELSTASPAREALFAEFRVFEDLGDLLLVHPEEANGSRAAKRGLGYERAEVPEGAEGLYVVSLRKLDGSLLAAAGTVLKRHGDIAVIAAAAGGAALLTRPTWHYGLERGIRRLSLRAFAPAKPFKVPAGWGPGNATSRAADPKIQAMVTLVDEAEIEATVQAMENMGERKAGSGDAQAVTYLVNRFQAIPNLTVTTHSYSSTYADNVIAELPGVVDPSVIYVVGGHYDSTSYSGAAPGADDNASGTAGVMEIARILSQYPFKYTLRFCAFGAEEVGLVGSDAYCDDLVAQNANVQGMINLDMTSYRKAGDPYDVEFVTNYSNTTLMNFTQTMYQTYVPNLGINQGSLSGGTSDHQSFTLHGYAAIFPFEDISAYSPYIHSSNDVIGLSANDFILGKRITQGVLAAMATLASPVDLTLAHTPLADTTDASGPYPVECQAGSLIGSNVTQVTLYHDSGSGYQAEVMAWKGQGDDYIGSIPGMPTAGYVKYYLEAEDDQGNVERLPDGLTGECWQFFVGYLNDVFADDFESRITAGPMAVRGRTTGCAKNAPATADTIPPRRHRARGSGATTSASAAITATTSPTWITGSSRPSSTARARRGFTCASSGGSPSNRHSTIRRKFS